MIFDQLDDLFKEVEKNTVIVNEPSSELADIVDSLDDVPLDDDFPSTGSLDTFQILKPLKPKDNQIVFL